jgi:4-hydroxybenzoate polyprenyltransferase/phosphoserine phosphatase
MNSRDVAAGVPLCVDLDGTLIASDTLFELFLVMLRREPWAILALPFWLLRGRAYFKQRLAEREALDVSRLPYRSEVVAYLKQERAGGRTLVLVTAAHQRIADAVAQHLDAFDRVLATDGSVNLKGSRKAAKLVEEYGERGFDYLGDSSADVPVWAAARHALVVGTPSLEGKAKAVATIEKVFATSAGSVLVWLKALRVYQWVKNILIFVPLVTAHRMSEGALLMQSITAFIAFSLCASAVYVINDLFDLDSDRTHARKSKRPFASGRLSIASGLVAAPLLLVVAFGLSAFLPPLFSAALLLYFVVTLLYSLRFKRSSILDVLILAGLYTIRLIAGAVAVSVPLTFWLLAFSMFLFLSLALVKRVAELRTIPQETTGRLAGRGYRREDLPVLMSLGTASGYTCVMVFALYIDGGTKGLYSHPKALWLLCPLLLFWISRIWLVTHRGEMHDDPIVFAFRDSISRWLLVPAAIALWLAI